MQKAGRNIVHLLVSGLPVLEARPNVLSKNPGLSFEPEDICLLRLTLDSLERLRMFPLALARHVPDINICNEEIDIDMAL